MQIHRINGRYLGKEGKATVIIGIGNSLPKSCLEGGSLEGLQNSRKACVPGVCRPSLGQAEVGEVGWGHTAGL